ncbi:aldo/keto reductase [Pseudomonas typographi]|uniref:Aldo/keto reductase n=1 Tax=Pseudomonas typographi TaxID=2715964 RepID=A0ABR7Z3C8_9PSED|nr:aldo/keto reductase [Pseudomonas typographi]MBD1551924.1 aldo/keto reductase [Pseudomonas typographi]MBD1599989.1 aldo/keto reductase [Pseudomonas typographi]
MQYTRLGNTGLTVSRLGIGTMTFGLQSDEATARDILDRVVDAGVTFIDTADVYPIGGSLETVGRTEEIIGRWLPGRRDNIILATKAVAKVGPHPWNQGASRKHLLKALDDSLRRLNTDYVDLYQLHSDDAETPLDETLEALDSLVRTGKVRYIGVSNFLAYRLALALGRSDVRQLSRFISVQPRYSLLFREIERELLPLAAEQDIGVIVYNPLAGGLLSGKHRLGDPTPGTRFTLGSIAGRYQARYWHEREFNTLEALKGLANEHAIDLVTLSIAWVLANPQVSTALIGASRPEQLQQTLAAADLALDPQLKARLDEVTHDYRFGDAVR